MRKEPSAVAPSNDKKSKRQQAKADLKLKASNRLSNKEAKKRQAAAAAATAAAADSSDYESEDDDEEFAEHDRAVAAAAAAGHGKQEMFVAVQVVTPPWADQVVEFVLDALGWSNPEGSDSDDEDEDEDKAKGSSSALTEMSGMSTDFKSQHLVALLPTLWTLLNCLETKRREWVFEALMAFFDQAHVHSGSKRTILQFLTLVIKLQSHPHYTGSFTINVPGAPRQGGGGSNRKALLGLAKKDRKEQQASIQKLSNHLAASLLKLPKLLWDLGTERIETSQTVLDLLAWVTVIAGEPTELSLEGKEGAATTGAAIKEAERAQFVKTLQSYMALFFCVTVAAPKGSDAATRTIMGPFVKLPPALQRRAIEIVFYSGVVSPLEEGGKKVRGKKGEQKQQVPLLAAVKSCCQGNSFLFVLVSVVTFKVCCNYGINE